MEKLVVARICIEIAAEAALPSRIILNSPYSKAVVDVEYAWKPSKCGHCQSVYAGGPLHDPKVSFLRLARTPKKSASA
ncbi:hypothetical protein Nepgr_007949 [Nepenthes gracilis]|uniref:Uncharacterized protein n=1 Tax=Nepenthes gracilis TaxID=150966 RepID=A0AAD3S820_NEPGR|nr:hypothetical protein Nepgr_007949 [Nepenthes gracilis]